MAPLTLILSLLFAFLLHGQQVLAGSAIWQPALVPRSRPHSLNRRYFYARKAAPGFGVAQPWPNRVIKYCFNPNPATQAAKAMLKKNLKDARKIWVAKGLNSNFRIEEAHGDACLDLEDVLMISYTGNGANSGMGSSVGQLSTNNMHLTDRVDMGMLDVVANFAHELGHAWGLYHEHQNPNFWQGVVDATGNGELFGPGNPGQWNCENLIDYASVALGGGLVVQTGQNNQGNTRTVDMQRLCSSYDLARGARFTALDYLPMGGRGTPHSTNGKGVDDVDWSSIMIYASGAGAVPLDPGEEPGETDRRARILQQPNGERIAKNLFPSALDILALNTLYADVGGTKLSLLNSMTSFKKVYKTSDSGPSGGSGCL
ncbi:hypothetical protein QBC34DRAFT_431272 [Podospora aff. communis PSN243]|uniref:Metalloendopeptidase n=1 Tax=Podospora aff. communis PSN243 TaxID=3040156 RepID=A0AAV9G3U7_9PEZI|nr:hypothetical protein QBC34DRAFT_431272 [Podospora aff. communis PSN243]